LGGHVGRRSTLAHALRQFGRTRRIIAVIRTVVVSVIVELVVVAEFIISGIG